MVCLSPPPLATNTCMDDSLTSNDHCFRITFGGRADLVCCRYFLLSAGAAHVQVLLVHLGHLLEWLQLALECWQSALQALPSAALVHGHLLQLQGKQSITTCITIVILVINSLLMELFSGPLYRICLIRRTVYFMMQFFVASIQERLLFQSGFY